METCRGVKFAADAFAQLSLHSLGLGTRICRDSQLGRIADIRRMFHILSSVQHTRWQQHPPLDLFEIPDRS